MGTLILELTDMVQNDITSKEIQGLGLNLLTMKSGGLQCSAEDIAIIETSKTSLTDIKTKVEKVVTKTESQIKETTGSEDISISKPLLTDDGNIEEAGEVTVLKT